MTTHRYSSLRFAPPLDATLRRTTPLTAPHHNAPLRFSALHAASLHVSTLRVAASPQLIATLRPAALGIAPLRSTPPRNSTPHYGSLLFRAAPHRAASPRVSAHLNATQRKDTTMKRCRVHIEGLPGSPYSQSAQHAEPKFDRESHDDYDERTWRLHATSNDAGQVCIPAMALKQAIDSTAYKLGEKVPGRRGATYKNFFASGFFCEGDVALSNGKPISVDDAQKKTINANADGVRGSGKRVVRRFPVWDKWRGIAEFTITDDIITRDVFERHAIACGMIVGIGRFRPEKGGTNGRFKVTKFEWEDIPLE